MVDRLASRPYTSSIVKQKELGMLKLIGIVAVTWFMFWTGIAQFLLIGTAALGTMIFG